MYVYGIKYGLMVHSMYYISQKKRKKAGGGEGEVKQPQKQIYIK